MRRPSPLGVLLLGFVLAALPAHANAQSLKDLVNAKKKADAAAKAAKQKQADSVRVADSTRAADSAKAAAKPGTPTAETKGEAKASPKVWDNYDFIPGNKVIVYSDFSDDKVGNFARRLKYKGGSMDVVDRDGAKMLRANSRSEFLIPLGRILPARFTLELDVIAPATYLQGYDVIAFEGGPVLDRDAKSAEINWNTDGTVIIGGGQGSTSAVKLPGEMYKNFLGQVAHIRVLMDGDYFKLYVNERRMYNIPELPFARDSVIRVFMRGSEDPELALYISSIRVAESETDVLYDALTAKGRWATQGILFATGKAELKPESTPVLKEIASTMKEHQDLKILIEGHTDNVGQPASNLALSDARAAAVKAALTADYGIAADRISTKGFGDTKPSVPNATPEGRAQNRRVEIVKQ